jgi:hypothetical protein
MPAIFVTADNIEFLKNALRLHLPDVKSSHRLEALAAALSYGTYAALRTDFDIDDEIERPALRPMAPEHFDRRLRELGYSGSSVSWLITLARAADLPHPVWREFRSGDFDANNRWFRACRTHNIPNVWVEMRTKYAKLNWDCISVELRRLDYLHDGRGDKIVDELFRRFQTLAHPDPGKSILMGSAYAGSVDKLLPDIARALADEFFVLLCVRAREALAVERFEPTMSKLPHHHRFGGVEGEPRRQTILR